MGICSHIIALTEQKRRNEKRREEKRREEKRREEKRRGEWKRGEERRRLNYYSQIVCNLNGVGDIYKHQGCAQTFGKAGVLIICVVGR